MSFIVGFNFNERICQDRNFIFYFFNFFFNLMVVCGNMWQYLWKQ